MAAAYLVTPDQRIGRELTGKRYLGLNAACWRNIARGYNLDGAVMWRRI